MTRAKQENAQKKLLLDDCYLLFEEYLQGKNIRSYS